MTHDLLLSHSGSAPPEAIDDLLAGFPKDGVDFGIEAREDQAFAAIEWLIPTAIVLFMSQKYFGAILSEAGKEHYRLLRKWLDRFTRKATNIPVTYVSSSGKLSKDPPGSLSIYVELGSDIAARFVFPRHVEDAQIGPMLVQILSAGEEFAAGRVPSSLESYANLLEAGSAPWRIVFRWDGSNWQPIDAPTQAREEARPEEREGPSAREDD